MNRVKKYLKRKKAQRTCIIATMKKTGWDRKTATKNIEAARRRLEISYRFYDKYNFCKLSQDEQDKKYKKIQEKRKEKRRIAAEREDCILATMKKRDWTREEAVDEIEKTVKKLGITYRDYDRQGFAMLDFTEQRRRAEYLEAIRTERREKNRWFTDITANKMQWSRQKAVRDMKTVQRKFAVDFESYDHYGFAHLSEEQRQTKSAEIEEDIKQKKRMTYMRNQCIWKTMRTWNVDWKTAVKEVDDAVADLGITYEQYHNETLFLYEKNDKKYIHEMNVKELIQNGNREIKINNIVAEVANLTRCTHDEIYEKYQILHDNYGCNWNEFRDYKLYELCEKMVSELFFTKQVFSLMREYNTDRSALRLARNKERTNNCFGKYMTRKWCVNRNITLAQFKELFEGEKGVIYKPIYGFQAKGIKAIFFDNSIDNAYHEMMSYPRGVVESLFQQHPEMSKLNPSSVNCLRVCSISARNKSVLENGQKKDIAYVSVKMGRTGQIADNVIAGGLVAGIDLNSGVIATDAVDHDMKVFTEHPDTGTRIRGFRIPYFDETLELVNRIIEDMQLYGIIGWDIAIGINGPELIEPNFSPAAGLLQAPWFAEGKGMKPHMNRYLWREIEAVSK